MWLFLYNSYFEAEQKTDKADKELHGATGWLILENNK